MIEFVATKIKLTIKLCLQDKVLVQLLPIYWFHGAADFCVIQTHRLSHIMQGVGHCVHSVHHEHDLGLLLEFAISERMLPAANVVQTALKAIFPEFSEPRVPRVVVWIEVRKVRGKVWDGVGSQLNSKSSICHALASSHHTLLRSPSIAGHPDKRDVHALRSDQEFPGVFASSEEDHYFSIGLLQQRSDDPIITEAVHGAADLG